MSENLPAPSGSGLAPNLAGALAYLIGPFSGIFFLVVEKENAFVRFHAAQSIAVSIALFVAGIALSVATSILAFIPVLGWIVALALSMGFALGTFGLWVYLMVRAFGGSEWEVPVVGAQARKHILPAAVGI